MSRKYRITLLFCKTMRNFFPHSGCEQTILLLKTYGVNMQIVCLCETAQPKKAKANLSPRIFQRQRSYKKKSLKKTKQTRE